jgi:hypothetical protein
MFMIVCVIDQPEHLNPVLAAWRANGINGVTILESTGLHRLTELPHVPMRYAFGSANAERGNITLFTVVETEEMIQRCLELTETVIGDFNSPNTGIFVSWPLGFTKGVTVKRPHSGD